MQLLYIADPLCSWCYGFGIELGRLLESHPGTRIDMVMGGLRPFNREPMSDAFRDMLRKHWHHVAEASGLPFSFGILDRDGFVYDTEPACRAVVTARALAPALEFAYFKAIQSAFYRDMRDVTQAPVLADLAAETGYGRGLFLEQLESEAMRKATVQDFAAAQSLGVSGFPTLAVRQGTQLYLAASGYSTADVLAERVAEIERRAAAPDA